MQYLHMGIKGTGTAGILTNGMVLSINLMYTYAIEEIREAVFWPDRNCFYGISEYLEIGLPSAVMVCLDGLAWHLMSLTTGYLGVNAQAAQILVMNIVVMFYQVSFGLQQAATTLIGQRIG